MKISSSLTTSAHVFSGIEVVWDDEIFIRHVKFPNARQRERAHRRSLHVEAQQVPMVLDARDVVRLNQAELGFSTANLAIRKFNHAPFLRRHRQRLECGLVRLLRSEWSKRNQI